MAKLNTLSSLDPTKTAVSLFQEFKTFSFKGNVIDLAVGVVIGAAFGKITDSLVKQIIMPLVAILLPGDKGYLGWKVVIRGSEVGYGLFIGEVVNFLIVSAALFLFIKKFLTWVLTARKEEAAAVAAAPPPEPPLTRDQELLIEIRELLKGQQAAGREQGAGDNRP